MLPGLLLLCNFDINSLYRALLGDVFIVPGVNIIFLINVPIKVHAYYSLNVILSAIYNLHVNKTF